MQLIAYSKFSITTTLHFNEAVKKLQSAIFVEQPVDHIDPNYDVYSEKYFVGLVNNGEFEIYPDATSAGNSSYLKIKGKFTDNINSTRIDVTMVSYKSLFLTAILFPVIFLVGLFLSLSAGELMWPNIFFLGVPALGYLITMYIFNNDRKLQTETLLYVFEAEIVV